MAPTAGSIVLQKAMLAGFWNIRIVGQTDEPGGDKPKTVVAKLGGHHDPGYWDTSRMVLEAGLCLALQVRHLCLQMICLALYFIKALQWLPLQ